MSLSIQCPGCNKKLVVLPSHVGKRVKCPGCGQVMVVPASVPVSQPSGALRASTTNTHRVISLWFVGGGIVVVLLFVTAMLLFRAGGQGREAAKTDGPVEQGKATPSATGRGQETAKSQQPVEQGKPLTQEPAKTSVTTNSGKPLRVEVVSLETKASHDVKNPADINNPQETLVAKSGYTLAFVRVSFHNDSKTWGSVSSLSFRISDKAGKPVDAVFLGCEKLSGAYGTSSGTLKGHSFRANGQIPARWEVKVSPDSKRADTIEFGHRMNLAGLREATWELGPSETINDGLLFSIPANTDGPRFEAGN